jgi:hypothetical protein
MRGSIGMSGRMRRGMKENNISEFMPLVAAMEEGIKQLRYRG